MYRYLYFTDKEAAQRDEDTGPRSHSWSQDWNLESSVPGHGWAPELHCAALVGPSPIASGHSLRFSGSVCSFPIVEWGQVMSSHLSPQSSRWPACWGPHQVTYPWSPETESCTFSLPRPPRQTSHFLSGQGGHPKDHGRQQHSQKGMGATQG